MKKVLVFISLYFLSLFCSSAFSFDPSRAPGAGAITSSNEQWKMDRKEFVGKYDSLLDKVEKAIDSCDGGSSWIENIKDLQTQNQYSASLDNCRRNIDSYHKLEIAEADHLKVDLGPSSASFGGDSWKKLFPEHQQHIHNFSNEMTQYMSSVPSSQGSAGAGMGMGGGSSITANKGFNLLRSSLKVGFVKEKEQDPFIIERKNILSHYGCAQPGSLAKCYNQIKQRHPEEVNCLKKVGFKKCRPFLKGGCQANDVLALSSEIFQEDKDGMAYI
ncbi:MAG: hypothetical protein OXB86_06300, partial [Bdellovibrionales bacterium]|nr:hypothetical protein [Bdellovibrionales bacterium]